MSSLGQQFFQSIIFLLLTSILIQKDLSMEISLEYVGFFLWNYQEIFKIISQL